MSSTRPPRPDDIKRAIDPAEFYAAELADAPHLKARRDGWTQNLPCPFHADPNPSFGVNLHTGGFRCFGCEAQGGSVIDFAMLRDGLTLDQARAALAERYGINGARPDTPPRRPAGPREPRSEPPRATGAPSGPIPPEALPGRPKTHPKHGRPSTVWTYADLEGAPLAFVCRFDPPQGRKVFAPLTWTAEGWTWKAPEAPRPLYGLDRLAARPAAPVIFAEGEKAADAAAALLPESVAVTTMNGAQAPQKSDFAPLAGRLVRIWPDADPPGLSYAGKVAELARAAGAARAEVLALASLAVDPASGAPRELPKGWDAADALADGWTAETLAARAHWGPPPSERPKDPDPKGFAADGYHPPHPFELHPGGIYYRRPSGSKGAKGGEDPPVWICPPFRVLAVTRDQLGAEFGRLVEFLDLDQQPRREVIADRERQGSGDYLRARLAAAGFEVATHPEARRMFLELLRRWTPPARARSVSKTGWTDDGRCFVLPERVLGEGPEPVLLAAEGERPAFACGGTLEDWRRTIGALCVRNSRLLFCVSLALAPPLLRLIGGEGGGFHLRGASTDASSSGKTTAQFIASSVFGPPAYLQRWRATDNALESLAELHNDALLILDELNQIEPRAAGEAAYLLANGAGKARADRTAAARPVKRWRLLFLSSGEIGLAEHMASAQRKTRAGQEIRMVELPADAGAGLGLFEDLHGMENGAVFALRLAELAATNYGWPFVRFVEAVIAQRSELPAVIKASRDRFTAGVLHGIHNPPGQVRRVAARFALVAVAGELATEAGITGWPQGAAYAAAERCFSDWLRARGGAAPAEERELVRQVRHFFELHSNRFRWKSRALDDHAPEVPRQAGFKDDPADEAGGLLMYVYPEVFRREVVEGFDPVDAARVLARRGMLRLGTDGKATQKVRIPGFAHPARFYVMPRDLGAHRDD